MPSVAIEDYIKQIYLQNQNAPEDLVSMGALAEAMDVVPGTATAMVKRLADSKLISYEPYSGVRLTERGQKMAIAVLRKHRRVETFLDEALGLDWAEVHEEAEKLEHAISDTLLDRIDALLKYPAVDPHGDPIPDSAGNIRAIPDRRLAECEAGQTVRIARVVDQDNAFLRFVDRHGLKPGTTVRVLDQDAAADAVTVEPEDATPLTMGHAAAAKLMVEPA